MILTIVKMFVVTDNRQFTRTLTKSLCTRMYSDRAANVEPIELEHVRCCMIIELVSILTGKTSETTTQIERMDKLHRQADGAVQVSFSLVGHEVCWNYALIDLHLIQLMV